MMPSFTGVSLFVSVTIIVWRLLTRGVRVLLRRPIPLHATVLRAPRARPVLSLTIIIAVAGITLALYGGVIHYAAGDSRNNLTLAHDALVPCVSQPFVPSERTIILRLDDVQSYGWTNIALQLMHDTVTRDIPIVAGVIPKGLTQEAHLVQFLKRHECKLELAIHGWDHVPVLIPMLGTYAHGEFAFLDAPEATERIDKATRALRAISRTRPVTFIPPQNQLSDEAQRALHERDLKIISGEGDGAYDYHAATWNFNRNEFVGAETVIEQCEQRFATGEILCVIMLHPQDFATSEGALDPARYREYQLILEYIEQRSVSAVRFSDLPVHEVTSGTPSSTTP